MIHTRIDGRPIEVEEGTTILDAARRMGMDIPTLCHHDILKPAGACRLCVVEEKRSDWTHLVTSCSTPVRDGAEYTTNSPEVNKARKLVVGLLLSRWPNVPVVKELAETIGVTEPLFFEEEYIEEAEDACIRCGMCIRVCDEIVKASALSWDGRGTERMVTTPYHEYSDTCIVCGSCTEVCPTGHIKLRDADGALLRHDEIDLGPNSAIHLPTMQAIPNAPFIDTEYCIHFQTDGCGYCAEVCEREAIDFNQQEEEIELDVGSIILTTGYKQFDPRPMRQYGYGEYPNVITGLEFEIMNCASGSTGGRVVCANGEPPKSVAILHCIGSRDKNYNEYCSRVCCMYALKFAHLVKEKTEAEVYDLYIDMRCPGKSYEEFYDRLLHEDIRFIRGKAAEVTTFPHYEGEEGKLIVRCEDTLTSMIRRIPVDMVILCGALEAQADASTFSRLFGVSTDKHGWMIERHPKLAPVETASDGVFIAGCAQGPKDIPDTVAQASAAASMALQNIQKGVVELEGYFAVISEDLCCGCRVCNELCPYGAIVFDDVKKISLVEEALCKACGTCVSACPSSAIEGKHFTDVQILAELEGVLS
jgi:heterodisulfide reductase subunit A2